MKNLKNAFILLLAAIIWGIAFVAQTTGGDAVGPYSFNCIRSFIGAAVLIPVIKFMDAKKIGVGGPKTKEDKRHLLIGGVCCGICLASASIFQQLGLFLGTAAGKAGFLTTCYIIMVPILGLFLKKHCGWNIWIAVVITLFGLYLLCINDGFLMQTSDIYVLLCSVLFSLQIMCVDHFVVKCDPVRLSQLQFLTAGIISMPFMIMLDIQHSMEGFKMWLPSLMSGDAWIALLYAGVMSSGVAYTLQMVGQKGFNPTIASLIMSLESVFSVLAGWLLLGQKLSGKELFGCLLIFIAVIFSQIPFEEMKK